VTPQVVFVVLNWNNADDTLRCLESLAGLEYPTFRVLVVDNGSSDDSVERINRRYPGLLVLETHQNLGYAGGNNVGIRHALQNGADYICILNNDVVVSPDFLLPLLTVVQDHEGAGVATPLIAETGDRERVWALGLAVERKTGTVLRRHAGERVSDLHIDHPFDVDVASGAAMLVKRSVFESVGLLDEDFYLYFEEADWCLQIRQANFRILAVPASVVWHKVSATLGQTSPAIDYYMLRNQLRFIARCWTGPWRTYLLGRTVLRNLLTIAAYTVKSHDGQRLPHRNARLLALRDALLGHWNKMRPDVWAVCYPEKP
jgi:GT2 family glycosyltransferase